MHLPYCENEVKVYGHISRGSALSSCYRPADWTLDLDLHGVAQLVPLWAPGGADWTVFNEV